MKMKCMMPKKTAGARKKKSEPDQRNGASNINSIPGYIGFRENRNGPDLTNVTGSAVGQIGFFSRRNSPHAHIMTPNPAVKAATAQPGQEKGDKRTTGAKLCQRLATATRKIAMRGGLSLRIASFMLELSLELQGLQRDTRVINHIAIMRLLPAGQRLIFLFSN